MRRSQKESREPEDLIVENIIWLNVFKGRELYKWTCNWYG